MGWIHSRRGFLYHCVPYDCLHLAENTTFASYRIFQNPSVFAVRAMRVLLFYWSISACIHCRFAVNSMGSRCLHSFPFNPSRIKFLLLSYFFSSFPCLFYRLMRALSKVKTRRGPFFDFVSFLLCLRYFPLPLLIFDFLNVPCLLLLLLCSYFCNIVFFLINFDGLLIWL